MNAQVTFLYSKKGYKEWIPKAGWNPSFFPKDKIICSSCYWYYRDKGASDTYAESCALTNTYEKKFQTGDFRRRCL